MKLTKNILKTTDNYIKALEKAGIITIKDFLNHFPKTYDDRTNVLHSFSFINLKEKNTILVKLVSINSKKTANNKLLTKALLEDKNSFLAEAVWFNRKYFASQISEYVGKKILVSGKIKYDFGKISFVSPEVETDTSKISGTIVPVYSELNYIPGFWIAKKMTFLQKYITEIEENLPDSIVKKYDFISRQEAYYKLHFPSSKNDYDIARYRFAYEELFEINYKAIGKKYKGFKDSETRSLSISMDSELIKKLISDLPFVLSDKQKITLFQILKDMEKNHAMSRLLEGDVGTGKTIVALISTIHSILKLRDKEIFQVAFMAPTEILARQHFESSLDMLTNYKITSNLLIGSTYKKQKNSIKSDLKNGDLDIVFGTHAILQENIFFKNLGFVIIDEQHRFGVAQRERLEKGIGNISGIIPHCLSMTATPIPRTLALTLYGNQDLSIINEYPKGRKEIFTKVARNDTERKQIELFVRNELEKGKQVFWVSPLIEESEKIDLANAIATYESLVNIFSPFNVGLLHGKMRSKDKEKTMKDFFDNKIQILSSTSVVEVGVDVSNATIMCIEGAERFGLSQLHQFRGRVGRGEDKSYCYLFPSFGKYTDRLRAMERTNNGFELSEIDLEIRGPGEVYGVKQSGLPDLKIANFTDLDLISKIREDIEEFFGLDSKKPSP